MQGGHTFFYGKRFRTNLDWLLGLVNHMKVDVRDV